MPPATDRRTSAAKAAETLEERPCGVTAVVLADGHSLEIYEFVDVIMGRLGRESGTLINLRKPGHPGRCDDSYKEHRSPELERRDLAAVAAYEKRVAAVGGGDHVVLAALSEEVRELIGSPRVELPALAFQIPRPPHLGGGYESVLVRIPLALLKEPSARRDLENVLCEWLSTEAVLGACPNFPMTDTAESLERIRTYFDKLERAISGLAVRSTSPVPARRSAPPSFFPTPAGTLWSQVTIRFRDEENIVAQIKGRPPREVNFAEMGMRDRRSGRPSVQWELLRDFAIERGQLDWTSEYADRRSQKRRENLAKDLKAYFRIDEDPFEWLPDRKAWRSKFVASPPPDLQ
ncbi:MAG: hypothetical protein U0167_19615 [bacterium]